MFGDLLRGLYRRHAVDFGTRLAQRLMGAELCGDPESQRQGVYLAIEAHLRDIETKTDGGETLIMTNPNPTPAANNPGYEINQVGFMPIGGFYWNLVDANGFPTEPVNSHGPYLLPFLARCAAERAVRQQRHQ